MFPYARIILVGAALSAAGFGAATAQDAPPPPPAPDTRCGGLLCDLGIVNVTSSSHRLDEGLPCGIFCRALGGQPAPPPQAQPVVAVAPASEPANKIRHAKRKRVAAKARTADPASDAAPKPN